MLIVARQWFSYVSADKFLQEDMAENTPIPVLGKLTLPCNLGHVDAFVSHSWHDLADAKWTLLQEWREKFKKEHKGREPTLRIDKYCTDQATSKAS